MNDLVGAEGHFNYWPSVIDLLASALLVFLLLTYVQSTLRVEDLSVLAMKQRKSQFVEALKRSFGPELRQRNVEYDDGEVNSVLIRFADNVLFETGDYRLGGSGRQLIIKFRRFLNTNYAGINEIEVGGHTDSEPYPDGDTTFPTNNWDLSGARAAEVVYVLSSGAPGFDRDLLSANAYADNRPRSNIDRQNRRVEVRVIFSSRERPR
ncbi:MAG: OmpA family protein [Pseudomonadota bacterium]